MANLCAIQPGSTEVTLPDLFSPESQPVVIELDPQASPLKNAQSCYHKFNKQKRAKSSLIEQLQNCTTELEYLESINVATELAKTQTELAEIKEELAAAGYFQAAKKRSTVTSSPHKVVVNDSNYILIGKNNKQNDYLTFKQARPDDLWLHTKDIPGSHVILHSETSVPPDAAALNTAAMLAAYFSKARHSAKVPVDYTKCRHVKKPAGAKPGFVIYEQQTTIYVTPEEELINKLLPLQ